VTRRTVLRGAMLGAAGIASAALLGCASTKSPASPGPAGESASSASGTGIPKNIKRAPGFSANLGLAPVNEKKVIQGGTFRRDATDTTREQDPEVSIGGSDHELVNDRLFNANGWTMGIAPDLLASYELVDKQGLQILLKLRPGIKTHNKPPVNGRVFTASDVAYSINRKAGKVDPVASKKYARAAQFSGLDKAEAVDERTVKLTFGSPNVAILHALSDPRSQMIPREQDDIGYKDPMKFVGTGAWMQTEYLDGARQVFKANKDYYRSWDEGGRPGIDTYEKTVIADRASVIAATSAVNLASSRAFSHRKRRSSKRPQRTHNVPEPRAHLGPFCDESQQPPLQG
jgi:ABC-type transport system substrate-binding protein